MTDINVTIANGLAISVNITEAVGQPTEKFTDLADVPQDYIGQAGKLVRVNETEDGLVFSDI